VGNVDASAIVGMPITLDLLADSSDPQGYSLSVSSVGSPGDGTIVNNGDGTVQYTAWGAGDDSFSFTVTDPYGNSAQATANISVSDPAPPNVGDVSADATLGTPVTINLLANASDPQGYSLTVDSVGGASLGSVADNGDGTITYTPTSIGTDTIQFSVNDGHSGSVSATLSVDVADAPPTAGDIYVSTSGGGPVNINLLGNSSDAGGLALSLQSFGQGGAGSVGQVDADDVQYTPNSADPGSDSFGYTIVNSQGQTGSGTVYVALS
jgi:hypothetical protein